MHIDGLTRLIVHSLTLLSSLVSAPWHCPVGSVLAPGHLCNPRMGNSQLREGSSRAPLTPCFAVGWEFSDAGSKLSSVPLDLFGGGCYQGE